MANCRYEKIKTNVNKLSLEEEKDLVASARMGDKTAQEALISYNMGLIHIYVSRFSYFNIPYEDLFQEAIIGLLNATKHYNPNLGYRFSTFMNLYIIDALQRLVQTMGYDFVVPKSSIKYNQLLKGKHIYQRLTIKLNREPSIEEFAKSMQVSGEMAGSILNAIGGCLHLNAKVKGSEREELEYFLTSMEESVEEKVMSLDLTNRMANILNKILNPKQLFIIYHYYGFDGYEKMTLAEIGRDLQISHQAVHDSYKRALIKLRNYYETKKLTSYLDDPEKGDEWLKNYCDTYYQEVLNILPRH